MAERNWGKEFQAIINFNYAPDAAEDPQMKKLVRWILHIDEAFDIEAGKDLSTMMLFFQRKYNLDKDGFDLAMELCERGVIEESYSG